MVDAGASVGEGSTQMRPNHSFELQLVEVEVEDKELEDLVGSLQPNQPGVSQLAVEVIIADV